MLKSLFVLLFMASFSFSTSIINENFEYIINEIGDPFPAGWVGSSNMTTHNFTAYGHNSDKCIGWDEEKDSTHWVRTCLVTNPGTLTFWICAYNDASQFTVKVQISSNNTTWTDLASYQKTADIPGPDLQYTPYRQKTVNINSIGTYYIRWITENPTKGGFYIDDVILDEQPLPVELVSFNATLTNNEIELKWQTATEINNNKFEIERAATTEQSTVEQNNSISIQKWIKIGELAGYGNSNSAKYYSFKDNSFNKGNILYRLKQIDNNGTTNYSNIATVRIDNYSSSNKSSNLDNFNIMQNYPNPFNPNTTIFYSIPDAGKPVMVNLNIYNILGDCVATLVNKNKQHGSYSANFDAQNYASGVYIAKLTAGAFTKTIKMNLLK